MDENGLDEEDSDEEEEQTYEWRADGQSCATCDALDGTTYTSPPQLAHPHCQCEVHPARGKPKGYTDCENTWEFEAYSEWSGGPPENHQVVHVDITVTCWDGTTVTDTVDVDFGDDPEITDIDIFGDEVFDTVSEHAEELAAQNCKACTPTPVG